MNSRCAYEHNAMAGCEELKMKMVDSVVCPKPRRLSFLTPSLNDSIRPFRYFNHNHSEIGDSHGGSELLDIILTKGGNSDERSPSTQLGTSPPFFVGSPPSRASNPVIQDEHFGNGSNMAPLSPVPQRNGGCVRMKSGDKPVAVRIEGFDCLSRDRRNCSISAVAQAEFRLTTMNEEPSHYIKKFCEMMRRKKQTVVILVWDDDDQEEQAKCVFGGL